MLLYFDPFLPLTNLKFFCCFRFYQQGGLRNHKCCNDPGTGEGEDRKERRGRKPTYANDPLEQGTHNFSKIFLKKGYIQDVIEKVHNAKIASS
jgi:hypothetical protein